MRKTGTLDVRDEETQYQLVIVRALGYKHHIGLRRFIDEALVARQIVKMGDQIVPPDLIIVSLPTLFGVFAAARMKKTLRCSLVADVRDLWPDVLLQKLPLQLRPFFRLPVRAMRWRTSRALRFADAIIGTSEQFVNWATGIVGRDRTQFDRAFPLAYDLQEPIDAQDRSLAEVLSRDIHQERVAVFAGTLVPQFDFDLILKVATRMPEIGFVICGDGPLFEALNKKAPQNVYMTGWLGANALRQVLNRADVALAPYVSTNDFQANIPNKIVEYLASGLPIVSSLTDGLVANLLSSENVGSTAPRDDIVAWQSAITNWLSLSENELGRASEKCRVIFQERFDAQRVALEYVQLMEDLAR